MRDGKWHRLTVERTGRLLEMALETEGEAAVAAEGRSSGTKAVLNLHQKASKLFLGGVPPSFRVRPPKDRPGLREAREGLGLGPDAG